MSSADFGFVSNSTPVTPGDWQSPVSPFACDVVLIQEDDGTFSGVVLNLPGAGSCGDTEAEVIANVQEAVAGVIESHRAAGEVVPWKDSRLEPTPENARRIRVLVHA